MNTEALGYGPELWDSAKQRDLLIDALGELIDRTAREWHAYDEVYTGGAYADRANQIELLSPTGEHIDVQWDSNDPEIKSVLRADGTKRPSRPMSRERAAWLLRDHQDKYNKSVVRGLVRSRDAANVSIRMTNAQKEHRTLLIHASSEVLWYDEATGTARECEDELHTLQWIAGLLAVSKHPGFMRQDPWKHRSSQSDLTTG